MPESGLTALHEAKEKDSERELAREDVELIRDNATAIELPAEIARDMIKSEGMPLMMRKIFGMSGYYIKIPRIMKSNDVLQAELL